MAQNNGRGPSRDADFKYTDTIADKAADQGILVKQDAIIQRLNAAIHALVPGIVSDYDAFAVAGNNKPTGQISLDAAESAAIAGLIASVNLGETTVTTAYVDGATSLIVANVDSLGTRGVAVRLFIEGADNAGSVIINTLPSSGNTLTVADLDIAAAIGNRVVSIPSSVSANVIVDTVPVDLKN